MPACLAHSGHRVVCQEQHPERLRGLTKAGKIRIYEPALKELVWRGVRAETLRPKENTPWSC
jgi:UDP-glucose 6-dehydrogenase